MHRHQGRPTWLRPWLWLQCTWYCSGNTEECFYPTKLIFCISWLYLYLFSKGKELNLYILYISMFHLDTIPPVSNPHWWPGYSPMNQVLEHFSWNVISETHPGSPLQLRMDTANSRKSVDRNAPELNRGSVESSKLYMKIIHGIDQLCARKNLMNEPGMN